jgi:ribosome recycling factor
MDLFPLEQRMERMVELTSEELGSIRAGRASPELVWSISVDYHGTPTKLRDLVMISVPEARVIRIEPWDKSSLPSIAKAILKSDLGVNPIDDGSSLRLNLPPLSEERRAELSKLVRKRVEEGKVRVRNVRRDFISDLRKMLKAKEASEDEYRREVAEVERLTGEFIVKLEKRGKDKEEEIMESS